MKAPYTRLLIDLNERHAECKMIDHRRQLIGVVVPDSRRAAASPNGISALVKILMAPVQSPAAARECPRSPGFGRDPGGGAH